MASNKHSFIELPSPFLAERRVILFHENQDADRNTLLSLVLSGQHKKPSVINAADYIARCRNLPGTEDGNDVVITFRDACFEPLRCWIPISN